MKLGIIPLLQKGFTTNPDWARCFLRMIEEADVESVWTVEHPIMAEGYEPLYPYSDDGRAPIRADTEMCDPLEWLAFAAGVTERVNLGTGVLILPLHAPIILAKRVATLDALSAGRVRLGVGIGWQREEYLSIGIPYEQRGQRIDDGIAAMRALWTESPATYHGKFYDFTKVHSNPKPVRNDGVPILIGGSSDIAARRAGRLGDGFFPHAISPEEFAKRIETMSAAAKESGRDPGKIELTFSPSSWKFGASLDLGIMRAYAALGVSRLIAVAHEAMSTDLRDIERFVKKCRDDVIARL
jgi:probable F420-dependent oxidoreductase